MNEADLRWSQATACKAPDKVHIFKPIMPIFSPNPIFDHLLELSYQDDSNKWSNIGIGKEITQMESTEVNFTHFIYSYWMCTYARD